MNGLRRGAWMIGLAVLLAGGRVQAEPPPSSEKAEPWRGIHLLFFNSDQDLEILSKQVPALAAMGLNLIVLEVDYNFDFKSHPELRASTKAITAKGAGRLADVCRKNGIRLIPQFQAVGHQSWRGDTFALLKKYPQFDLTPGAFPGNKGIYCREYDPLNPQVNKIIFKLLDEIIEAFHADAFHVGMDEIFLIGNEKSPSTMGQDPAKVFAKAVNDLHRHLVKERHVEMLMWGDRLIDANKYHNHAWEASKNGTASAVDLIPKDIIVCPWHYELPRPPATSTQSYPSIPMLLDKGFRVLPASWKKLDASKALIEYSAGLHSPRMLGHLFTTWEGRKDVTEYASLIQGLKLMKSLEK